MHDITWVKRYCTDQRDVVVLLHPNNLSNHLAMGYSDTLSIIKATSVNSSSDLDILTMVNHSSRMSILINNIKTENSATLLHY